MTQLSRYTLLQKIGSSTLGAVYKAQDTATGSLVALKVIQLGLLDDVSSSEMDARLQRAYEAALRLQHPGIARVFEIRRDGRTALIATELVEGPPITSLAKSAAGSELSEVVAAAVQLLDALDFAHNELVLHRDLKPSNVLIHGGRIKITDFGMADLAARNRTDTGALVGETEYMAPEQFLSGTIDKRCDIHAAGTILYELLTGKSPFRGDPHTAAAMFKVLDFVPPPPSTVRPGLSPVFDSLLARALAKKPEQRLLSARLFRNELVAAYVAVTGEAPPEALGAVPVTVPRPSADSRKTTLIQARPVSPNAPSAYPDRAETPPGPAEAGRGMEATRPSAVRPSAKPAEEAPAAPASPLGVRRQEPSEPIRSGPLAGGTVLARPRVALAAEAVGETAEPPRNAGARGPLPAPPVPPQPAPARAEMKQPNQPPVSSAVPNAVVSFVPLTSDAGAMPAKPAAPYLDRPGNGVLAQAQQDTPEVPSAALQATSPLDTSLPGSATLLVAPLEPEEIPPQAPQSPPAVRPRAPPLPPKRAIPLTDESIARGGRVLAQFIGPIAVVFSRRAAQDTHDERAYFDLLAAHLSDADERAQFFRKLRERHV